MPYRIVKRDITKIKTDAIVNITNPLPVCVPGDEMDLYIEAGAERMLQERMSLGVIKRGEAKSSEGFDLKAGYVIHTAGPLWDKHSDGLPKELKQCYVSSFKEAIRLNCKSVAIPLIGSNVYGYTKGELVNAAMEEIISFLSTEDMLIYLVVKDVEAFSVSSKLAEEIDKLISKVDETEEESVLFFKNNQRNDNLDKFANAEDESFGDKIIRLMAERNLIEADIYKEANVDRRLFSSIRCNGRKKIKKETALALIVAMKLNIDESEDLLKRAGYALSPSYKFDRIVRYFIENNDYRMREINEALFKYTGKNLGYFEI